MCTCSGAAAAAKPEAGQSEDSQAQDRFGGAKSISSAQFNNKVHLHTRAAVTALQSAVSPSDPLKPNGDIQN